MRLFIGFVFLLIGPLSLLGQNPNTTFEIPSRTINLPCGTTCTNITAAVPHIKNSSDYVITTPAYQPFPWVTAAGIDITSLISAGFYDDQWTSAIAVPFPICYYGNTFNSLIVGTNSAISFDMSRAATGSGYSIAAGGTIPSSSYAPNMIFGPYHDIDIDQPGSNKRIEYRIEGDRKSVV